VTNIDAWLESAVSELRIITPAFVQGSVFDTAATRATTSPSPGHWRYTKWNSSSVPQTSAPDAVSW
jgi:hypothetical protein